MADSDNGVLGGGDSEASVIRRSRHWPADQKRRIVEETFAPGASVSVVARQHDVNTNLVFEWRRQYRQGNLINRKPLASSSLVAPDLVRIGVVNAAGGIGSLPAAMRRLPEQAAGVIEIELCGAKVRVDASIDEASLRRVLAVIRGVA